MLLSITAVPWASLESQTPISLSSRRLPGPISAEPWAMKTPARRLKSIRFLDALTWAAPLETRRPSRRLALRRVASATTEREAPWMWRPRPLP